MSLKNHFTDHFISLSLSPVFFATVACCAGILSCHYNMSLLFISVTFLCIYQFLFFLKKTDIHLIAVLCGVAYGGAYYRYESLVSHNKASYEVLPKKPFNACARVIDLETCTKAKFKTILTVALTSLEKEDTHIPFTENLRINVIDTPELLVDDIITLRALTYKPPKNSSFRQYLFKEGILASLYCVKLNYTLHKRPRYSFGRWRAYLRDRITKRLSYSLSPASYSLFCALFLGKKLSDSGFYKELRAYCTYWGIVHYLARSGLHVVLIASTLSIFLRLIPVHFFLKEALLLLFILIYHGLTWPSVSFNRALITLILYKIYTLQSLDFKTLHILSITTLIILFINPLQLFFLDFQLSFGLTGALAWFNEVKLVSARK
ncbi:ComEC/Rec2 family competence protein [Candidatus Dependentiae bacterium]|nr:ComEC/Rec2 family competence protein [Candidatus Dependentiae bacterium]